MTMAVRIVLGLGIVLRFLTSAGATEPERLFREQVAPIFETRCVHCHGANSAKGGLLLTTSAALRRGGKNGPAVEPGKPEESLLLEMVSGDPPEMPQKDKPLSKEQVEGAAALDRTGGTLARGPGAAGSSVRRRGVVGVPAPGPAGTPRGPRPAMGPHADRCVRPEPTGDRASASRSRGRSSDLDPPADLRPARPATDARGDRRLPRRYCSRCLREAGQPTAGVATIRRALGPPLARRRPLRRHPWLRQGQAPGSCLALSRLRDPILE